MNHQQKNKVMAEKENPVVVEKPAPEVRDADDIGHTGEGSNVFKKMTETLKAGLKEAEGKAQGGTNNPKFGHETTKLEKKTKEDKARLTKPPTPPKPEDKAKPEADVAPHIKTITGKKPDPQPETEPENEEVHDELPPENLKAEDWKKLKNTHKEALQAREKQIKELQGQLEQKSDTSALEAIKKERDELQARLETIALEKSPQFQNKYQKAFDRAATLAKQAVGEKHAEQIAALIQLPQSAYRDNQINEIREELSGISQGRLDNALVDMDMARDEMNSELANSKGKLAELDASEKQKAQTEASKQAELVEKRTKLTREIAKGSSAFTYIEGNEEHNQQIDNRLDFLDRFHTGKLTDEEFISLPALAKEAEWLSQFALPQILEENRKLKEELGQFTSSNPGVRRAKTEPQGKKSSSPFMDSFLTNNPTV